MIDGFSAADAFAKSRGTQFPQPMLQSLDLFLDFQDLGLVYGFIIDVVHAAYPANGTIQPLGLGHFIFLISF